ncbi:hypothetical protein BCR44DRAFT_1461469 [Catenaria anguillulae PL171]|uniref:Uncharacterized protein n=1 Tax=Catenaria anguillulae PL171 TaxID=765915 RepID=A0A1Y2HJV3_9FUNG|nr:hypothetical protein BCR44DRAFT_1461469 [Catenaria anguillulae PL171]
MCRKSGPKGRNRSRRLRKSSQGKGELTFLNARPGRPTSRLLDNRRYAVPAVAPSREWRRTQRSTSSSLPRIELWCAAATAIERSFESDTLKTTSKRKLEESGWTRMYGWDYDEERSWLPPTPSAKEVKTEPKTKLVKPKPVEPKAAPYHTAAAPSTPSRDVPVVVIHLSLTCPIYIGSSP